MSEHGYDVEQNPGFSGTSRPDFRIENKIFDNFAPQRGKSVRNIWSVIQKKVADRQTRRVILNLDDSDVPITDLKRQFSEWRIEDLEEVVAVRNRMAHKVFPETGN